MPKVTVDELGSIRFVDGVTTLEQLLLLMDLQAKLPELMKELSEKLVADIGLEKHPPLDLPPV